MKIADFEGRVPKLDLFAFFDGRVEGWGLVEDRFGRLRRQFHVVIDGSIAGDELTLDEVFRYADGDVGERQWGDPPPTRWPIRGQGKRRHRRGGR